MKRASILAMLVLNSSAAGALPVAAITGGEVDGDLGHPAVGLMIAEIDGEPEWRRSGTPIVLKVSPTAGHCTGQMGALTAARVWFDDRCGRGVGLSIWRRRCDWRAYQSHIPFMPGVAGYYHDVGLVLLDEPVQILSRPRCRK